MAQLAEQLICNQQVNGSSPLIGSIEAEVLIDFCFFIADLTSYYVTLSIYVNVAFY